MRAKAVSRSSKNNSRQARRALLKLQMHVKTISMQIMPLGLHNTVPTSPELLGKHALPYSVQTLIVHTLPATARTSPEQRGKRVLPYSKMNTSVQTLPFTARTFPALLGKHALRCNVQTKSVLPSNANSTNQYVPPSEKENQTQTQTHDNHKTTTIHECKYVCH